MNILLIINRFDFGGSENHVCDLANQLSKYGHKVLLVGGDGRQQKKLLDRVEYYRTKLLDIFILLHIIKIARLVNKYEIDIIHGHQRLAIVIACLAGLISNRKVVATVHGRVRYDMRSWQSRKLASKIIFVNKIIYNEAIKKYPIEKKSVYIPNGINISKPSFDQKPFSICHTSRIDNSHFRFLKLFIEEVLDKLVSKYPLIEFNIIGDGEKALELAHIAKKFNTSHKSNTCNVIGYSESVNDILKNSSLALGVGRVALEAMAIGVPLLSVNGKRFGGMVTVENYNRLKLQNFVDTTSPPPSPEKIYSAIVDFFDNKEFYISNAIKIYQLVSEDFSINNITDKMLDVYSQVLQSNVE